MWYRSASERNTVTEKSVLPEGVKGKPLLQGGGNVKTIVPVWLRL